MLTKLTNKKESGFTLIELMIVIAIIGILAAIAIPQFSAYRTRSYNSAAQADLRNAATAQEAYFVDENTYCATSGTLLTGTYGMPGLSANVTIKIDGGSDTTYSMRSWNSAGDASYIIRGPGGSISKY
ncbi:MAG: prepilin-type N-terminal cleavage/methylation domain-containing protein [Deltaproteobacteria bacterium]|nr:prepilin-type N-terminal cleavage/methylation domain-containing protein [Deltaproteobacteria bacterium]